MELGSRGYWVLVVVLIALSFTVGRLHRTFGTQPVELSVSPDPQTQDVHYQEVSLDTESWYPIANQYGPVALQLGPDDTSFLVRSTARGDRIEAIRSGDGSVVSRDLSSLPPDLQSISDTAVQGDRLWLADLLGGHLYFVDPATASWGTIETPRAPYRVEVSPDGRSLFVTHVGAASLLTRIDLGDDQIRGVHQFGELLRDQATTSLALDGRIARAGEQIVFAGKHLGILAAFDFDGELVYVRELVRSPPPPVIVEREGVRSLRYDLYPASISIAADSRDVFILTYRRVGVEDRYVLDRYRSADGTYERSFIMPEGDKWSSVALADDLVYLVGRSGIHQVTRKSFEIDVSRQDS